MGDVASTMVDGIDRFPVETARAIGFRSGKGTGIPIFHRSMLPTFVGPRRSRLGRMLGVQMNELRSMLRPTFPRSIKHSLVGEHPSISNTCDSLARGP